MSERGQQIALVFFYKALRSTNEVPLVCMICGPKCSSASLAPYPSEVHICYFDLWQNLVTSFSPTYYL